MTFRGLVGITLLQLIPTQVGCSATLLYDLALSWN